MLVVQLPYLDSIRNLNHKIMKISLLKPSVLWYFKFASPLSVWEPNLRLVSFLRTSFKKTLLWSYSLGQVFLRRTNRMLRTIQKKGRCCFWSVCGCCDCTYGIRTTGKYVIVWSVHGPGIMVMACTAVSLFFLKAHSCVSVFFQCKASHTSNKWMIKGSRIILWCSRACCLCLPSPEPVWLLEWSCTAGDVLHDPFKAFGVVDPCPWVWHPQCCFWGSRFCRLQSLHKVSPLLVINFPANGNLIS